MQTRLISAGTSLLALLALSACATTTAATPAPAPVTGVAPLPKQYTCAQTAAAAAEYKALPQGSALVVLLDDYGTERRALRAFHNLPLDGACTK